MSAHSEKIWKWAVVPCIGVMSIIALCYGAGFFFTLGVQAAGGFSQITVVSDSVRVTRHE